MAAAVAGLGEEPFALIGGMAMGAHGLSRSTADADILSGDRGVFALNPWDAARDAGVSVELRPGDASGPLVGVVRLRRGRGAAVDVVVVGDWTAPMLMRTERTVRIRGASLPLLGAADLVLLKLYAGGPLDLRDAEALLLRDPGLHSIVAARLTSVPERCSEAWGTLRVRSSVGS